MLKKLSLVCLLVLAACAKKSEENLSFLYVIMSNHGEISQAADGSWELSLDHGDIEKVLAFSNRPYRIVRHITGKQLLEQWSRGSDSFAKNPPNATAIVNQKLQTLVLLNMRIEGTKSIFKIRADGPQSLFAAKGQTQMFLDSSCQQNNTCQSAYNPFTG